VAIQEGCRIIDWSTIEKEEASSQSGEEVKPKDVKNASRGGKAWNRCEIGEKKKGQTIKKRASASYPMGGDNRRGITKALKETDEIYARYLPGEELANK